MVFAFLRESPFYEKALAGEEYGLFNGYVAFSDELPQSYMGMSWDDDGYALDADICPHGGITFDRIIKPRMEMIPITAIPDPSEWEDGIRCIGFDTAHLGDSAEKWDFKAVKAETLEMYNNILNLIKEKHG